MRIALTGGSGTGKTTLARALADRYGLPLIEEDMEGVVAAAAALSQGGVEAGRVYLEAGARWLKKRSSQQASLPAFVADRFAFDLLAMLGGIGRDDDVWFAALVRECIGQAGQLDLIIMPPLELRAPGAPPGGEMPSSNEVGLQRNRKIGGRLLNHSLTRGLMDQLLTVPRLYLPARSVTLEERLELVAAALKRLKLI